MSYLHILYAFLLFSILASCGEASSVQSSKNEFEALDSLMKVNRFNGVIMITERDSVIYEQTYVNQKAVGGVLELGSRCVIGSLSKQLTAMMVIREVDAGRIQLTDTIGRYLPELTMPWKDSVTVEQLLRHTHGIESLETPLVFRPGSEFSYSQLGYDLLSQILEHLSGQSFQELSTAFFRERGLTETFHSADSIVSGVVSGYEDGEVRQDRFSNYTAAGGFISTARDVSRWTYMLHHGELCSTSSLEEVRSYVTLREHPILGRVDYGLGIFRPERYPGLEGAFGYSPGFISSCFYDSARDRVIVVMTNDVRGVDLVEKFAAVERVLAYLHKEL